MPRGTDESDVDVLLIGNYEQDRQESMLRFSQLLHRELSQRGINVEMISPGTFLGGLPSPRGAAKWLGYMDKFVLFPIILRRRVSKLRRPDRNARPIVHICDHSNAMYAGFLKETPTLVTCHDLLAVRGARGEDTDCPASSFGKVLQRWILSGIKRADFVACDSTATRQDLLRLAGAEMENKSKVILLAQNYPYRTIKVEDARTILDPYRSLDLSVPFLLHVGSDMRRKNREAVLRAVAHLGAEWKGQVVFAGEPLGEASRRLLDDLGIADRVIEIVTPSNAVLEALYNLAFALVYPSRCEGFGWPVIEAQACGCPVICSNRSSLPEIAGAAALLCDPDNIARLAQAVQSLKQPGVRASLIEAGFANMKRFEADEMAGAYEAVYRQMIALTKAEEGYEKETAGGASIVIKTRS